MASGGVSGEYGAESAARSSQHLRATAREAARDVSAARATLAAANLTISPLTISPRHLLNFIRQAAREHLMPDAIQLRAMRHGGQNSPCPGRGRLYRLASCQTPES